MKRSTKQQVSNKAPKPSGTEITVSISQKKATGVAAGATLGALAAGPVGALVGGVVGSLVADNTDKVKKELRTASKAVLRKAPSLQEVEAAVVKAGKKTAVALKGGSAKVKAALVTPKPKPKPKTKAKAKVKSSPAKPALVSHARTSPKALPAKSPKAKAAAPAAARKPARRKG
jgi:hypothetical protein